MKRYQQGNKKKTSWNIKIRSVFAIWSVYEIFQHFSLFFLLLETFSHQTALLESSTHLKKKASGSGSVVVFDARKRQDSLISTFITNKQNGWLNNQYVLPTD